VNAPVALTAARSISPRAQCRVKMGFDLSNDFLHGRARRLVRGGVKEPGEVR
jgi:hypothetical protein